MLRYAKIKIGYNGNISYKSKFNQYKQSLSSKVAYISKKNPSWKVSNFDCDCTEIIDNCLHTFVIIEDTPMFLEICKCDDEFCSITVKST